MKRITPMQIAMTFAGSFLGAGFLSGQEILQFFGQFGWYGMIGMVMAIVGFWLFGLLVLRIAKRTGITDFDRIIVPMDNKVLRGVVGGVSMFFLFGVMVAMIAGAGSLLNQLFGLPVILGNIILTALMMVVTLVGASGVVAVFEFVVPLLVAAAVVISIWAGFTIPNQGIPAAPFADGNPLLGNWFFAALSFIAYNMTGAIAIMVPLAPAMEDERTVQKGMAVGSAALGVVFICILLPVILFRDIANVNDLPILALATMLWKPLGIFYSILLFGGMFCSAVAALFGITERVPTVGKLPPAAFIVLLSVLAFIGSLFGFKELVSVLYPICGYVGFFGLIGIVLHYRKVKHLSQTL